MMLAGFPLALFAGLLTAFNDAFAVLILLPLLCFVAGFARLLYGTFVEGRAPRVRLLEDDGHGPELSTPGAVPVAGLAGQRLQTAEMLPRASVTEGTTRLLEDDAGR